MAKTIKNVAQDAGAKKKNTDDKKPAIKVVSDNRRARHEYEIIEVVEAGIELFGTEVKSMRNGKANIQDAFARIEKGELW
jgi:SsrA-binding protein